MARKESLSALIIIALVAGAFWPGEASADDPRQTPLVAAIQKAQPAVAAIYVRK